MTGGRKCCPNRGPNTMKRGAWIEFRWAEFRWAGFRWAGFRWAGFRWAGFRWVGLVSRYPTHFPISHSFPDKSYYRGFNAYIAKHGYIRSLSSKIAGIHSVSSAHYIFIVLDNSFDMLRISPEFNRETSASAYVSLQISNSILPSLFSFLSVYFLFEVSGQTTWSR